MQEYNRQKSYTNINENIFLKYSWNKQIIGFQSYFKHIYKLLIFGAPQHLPEINSSQKLIQLDVALQQRQ